MILDRETGEAITTETLRYGQRVRVLRVSPVPIMRTPEALKVIGPAAFGLKEDYTPIENLLGIENLNRMLWLVRVSI